MPPAEDPDDVNDLAQPATRGDIRDAVQALRADIRAEMQAFREELRADMQALRGEVQAQVQTLRDEAHTEVQSLRHEMTVRFVAVDQRFLELRRHFDVVAESFKSDFRNLFDFVHATTDSTGNRLDALERDHGRRLDSLENRVTRLEKRRK